MQIVRDGNDLVVRFPLAVDVHGNVITSVSSTGKSLNIGGGNDKVAMIINGEPVVVRVNATAGFPNPDFKA